MIKKIWNAIKKIRGETAIDIGCTWLAAFSMYAAVLGIGVAVTSWLIGAKSMILSLVTIGYFIGYLLQNILLIAAGRRKSNDYSWEGNSYYFEAKLFTPILILAFVLFGGAKEIFRRYFHALMLAGLLPTFDDYSLQPYFCAAVCVLAMCAGAVVAFYPYNQILSFSRVLKMTAVMLLVVLLSNGSTLVSALYAMYLFGAVVTMNQSAIVRQSMAVTVTKIGVSGRFYNLRMILLALLLAAIGGGIMTVVLSGLWFLGRFLLYVFLIFLTGQNKVNEYRRPEAVAAEVEDAVFGQNNITGLAMLTAAIIIIVIAAVMIIFARSGLMQSIFAAIQRWFAEFVALFMGGRYESEPEIEINYRDEVEKVNASYASHAERTLRREKLTYRDFAVGLAAQKNDIEKLSYSYQVMIGLLANLNPSLRTADTPRELCEKIRATMSFSQIGDITDLIEEVKYAEKHPNDATLKKTIAAVCAVVEKQLV